MDNITQFFTTVSSWAVAITAIMAALTALFKPFRKLFSKIFGFNKKNEEVIKNFDEVKAQLKDVKADLYDIKLVNDKRDAEFKEIKDEIAVLGGQIERVSQENDDNERSRIRRDIMKYGMIARSNRPISEREFESLRMDYEKYHGALHGNGIVTEEYNFIRDYYNKHYAEWK